MTSNDLIGLELPILNGQGFLRVVDLMGDDSSLVQAARISYGKGTKSIRDDENLIRFLLRHDHGSPVEMVVLKVHVKAPLFVRSQWVRHRISSFNEYSARYSEMSDEFYYPSYEDLQKQSKNNRQGRHGVFELSQYNSLIEEMRQSHNKSYETYTSLLKSGVAREIARGVLPVNLMTQFYWQVNGRSLMNFLKLRCNPSGQTEIREYALALLNIFKQWLPITSRAFEDYVLKAKHYSSTEVRLIQTALNLDKFRQEIEKETEMSDREKKELLNSNWND